MCASEVLSTFLPSGISSTTWPPVYQDFSVGPRVPRSSLPSDLSKVFFQNCGPEYGAWGGGANWGCWPGFMEYLQAVGNIFPGVRFRLASDKVVIFF